jgi:hypothetical protein
MVVELKQKKISIPQNEFDLAKAQAEKSGFKTVTGYVRWLIRVVRFD